MAERESLGFTVKQILKNQWMGWETVLKRVVTEGGASYDYSTLSLPLYHIRHTLYTTASFPNTHMDAKAAKW